MTNDHNFNTQDKNQAIQEILRMQREIVRLQDQFGISNTELQQALHPDIATPQPIPAENPTENSTYEHGKKVGSWLKNVLK